MAYEPRVDGSREGGGQSLRAAAIAEHEARRATLQAEAKGLADRSDAISTWRGITFLIAAVAAGIVYFARIHPLAWIGVALAFGGFFTLVIRHAMLVTRADDVALRIRLVDAALARIAHTWDTLGDGGARFAKPEHPYAGDLDVFGPGSLFQLVSTAHTAAGEARLAGWLAAASPPDEVGARQAAAGELAGATRFREELERAAVHAGTSGLADDPLDAWAKDRPATPVHRLPLARIGRLLGPITTLLLVVSELAPVQYRTALRIAFSVALAVQLAVLRNLRHALESPLKLLRAKEMPFSAYLELVRLVEAQRFEAPALLRAQRAFVRGQAAGGGEVRPATAELSRLGRLVGWAELKHNGFAHLLINPLLLWDVHTASMLERWREEVGPRVAGWIDALAEVEALASLGAFAHDQPDFGFAKLGEGPPAFAAEGLGHPLIAAERRVTNDVAVGGPAGTPRALLVTGSNMSGKSTLLRAIGINAVLAQAGAPCCADKLVLTPLAVHTSMRVADSLREGVSHFDAELSRLKSVVAAADRGERVLFLLDEVLHGTNSRERQIGAKSVALHLCEAGAIGALSSHDLGLAGLEAESGGKVKSVHFEEQVESGKMSFDYKLKPGVVASGNALRLMRDLGLPVPPDA
jgi:hypothetical protein